MGHYDDAYAEEHRRETEEKRKVLTELYVELKDFMSKIRRSRYYNEHSTVHERLQEASFWLKNDIP